MDEKKQQYHFDSMLSVSQLAELLNVSKHTIYKWTSDKNSGIPFYKLKKSLRFRYGEIQMWMKKYRSSEGSKEFNT